MLREFRLDFVEPLLVRVENEPPEAVHEPQVARSMRQRLGDPLGLVEPCTLLAESGAKPGEALEHGAVVGEIPGHDAHDRLVLHARESRRLGDPGAKRLSAGRSERVVRPFARPAGSDLVAGGLLQATSLSIPIVTSQIGVDLGLIRPINYVALVAAGLVSIVVFPLGSLTLLRNEARTLETREAWSSS